MSRLSRIAVFPLKLVATLRRNGPAKVWLFASTMIGRYGLKQTLAYGLSTPARRREALVEFERAAHAPPPSRTPEAVRPPEAPDCLDMGFTIKGQFWRERREAVASARRRAALAAAPAAQPGPSVRLLVELDGPAALKPTAYAFNDVAWAPAGDSQAVDRLLAMLGEDDWVVVLQAGDKPAADLQDFIGEAARRHAPVDVLSFDLAVVREDDRVLPVFLPGPNAWAARYADIGFGRYALRVGALRAGATGYERLKAWLSERSFSDARDRWRHVAEPLVCIALPGEQIGALRTDAQRVGEAEHVDRNVASERVSVVICTHDRSHLLRQLIKSLGLDDPRLAEVIVVTNNVRSPGALAIVREIDGYEKVRVLARDEPFNFSRLSNAGAAIATGDRLLFLNDDVLPVSDDWMEPLLVPLRDPGVGVSGPLLLYPNERVQHAGIFLGYRGGAGHTLRHAHLSEGDYLTYASAPREVSAVTGAVMMVRRDLFDALGGFDELLATYLQDVDFCLRAGAVGASSVFTPFSILLHMESITMLSDEGAFPRLSEQRGREREHFLRRWPPATLRSDPFHNPSFDLEDETLHALSAA